MCKRLAGRAGERLDGRRAISCAGEPLDGRCERADEKGGAGGARRAASRRGRAGGRACVREGGPAAAQLGGLVLLVVEVVAVVAIEPYQRIRCWRRRQILRLPPPIALRTRTRRPSRD